ncbi:TIGR01906 family membrane protein [Lactococcus termiticola]|uniref:TIGR01906 family membrane protein n=1 Tax=Lactococcus termiticola TaxID=2169526 RepID=UPI00140250C5|nr:TIGR01906 family membrane protein [Lactococcus termiticola]
MRDRLLFAGTFLWGLALTVIGTVLLSIPLFQLEIGWGRLDELAGLSSPALSHNYQLLIHYLLNPFSGRLVMPDFPSSASGLEHFFEVKVFFMVALACLIVLLPAFVVFVKEYLNIFFRRGLTMILSLPFLAVLTAVLLGFDQFFVLFHELLFRNEDWLFDPKTDPIITVLPESFFLHCFILAGLIYLLFFGYLYFYKKKVKNV